MNEPAPIRDMPSLREPPLRKRIMMPSDQPIESEFPTTRPTRRLGRAILFGTALLLLCGIATLAGLTWNRGRIQRAKVAALEPFEAFVHAHYGEYQYVPEATLPVSFTTRTRTELKPGNPEEGTEDEWVTVEEEIFGSYSIYGGGLRIPGFGVCDDPPRHIGWMVPVFGEHCFARVTSIEPGETFTDDHVPLVLAFPDLRELNLAHTAVTDAGVRRLLSLEKLVTLDLWDRRLSEETLRMLAHCRQLRQLDLRGTGASAETREFLKRSLPACEIQHD